MKEEYITVLKVEPMKKPEVVTLENELLALQEAVSIGAEYRGLIECVGIEEGVDILLNEESKLIGLPPNRHFMNDILCGVFYIVGVDGSHFASLAQDKIEKYTEVFRTPQQFLAFDGALLILNIEDE